MAEPVPQGIARSIARLLVGLPPDPITDSPEEWGFLLDPVSAANGEGRRIAFEETISNTPDADSIRRAVYGIDPYSPPPKPRYTIHWAKEALELKEPVPYVVDGLFSARSVGVLAGEGGTKKTYLLLDAAVCVSHGIPWLDFETTQGPVLIVDEESGLDRIERRLSAIMKGHHADENTPVAYVSLEGFNLLDDDSANDLESLITETGAKFVILDALVDIMLSGDENSVKDTQPVFHALRVIADRTGAAIVVIHHTNRAGSYRGSSAIKGAVDTLLLVESQPDSARIDVTCEKSRDEAPQRFAANIYFEDDQVVLSRASDKEKEERLSRSEKYVLRYLDEHGNNLMTEIMSHADVCSEQSARQAVYALVEKGKVRRINMGGKGVAATYGLTGSPKELTT